MTDLRPILMAASLLVGCAPLTTTPSMVPTETHPVAQQRLALGHIDDLLGDPDAEVVRMRRLAEFERAHPSLMPHAAARLLAIHAMTRRLADTEDARHAALEDLRVSEALLLAIAANSTYVDVFELASLDAALYTRHPEATRRALEKTSVTSAAGYGYDVLAFARTLPPDLYARLFVAGVVRPPEPLEDALDAALGPYGIDALERLVDDRVREGDFTRAERVSARLLALDPGATSAVRHLALVRREPLVERSRATYERATTVVASPRDHGQFAAIGLAIALELYEHDPIEAHALATRYLDHDEERVRVVARTVLCTLEPRGGCPPAPRQTAERAARVELRSIWDVETFDEGSRDDAPCWFHVIPTSERVLPDEASFFDCARSHEGAPPDAAFARAATLSVSSASRVLAWLDDLEARDVPPTQARSRLLVALAFGSADPDEIRRVLAKERPMLSREARLLAALALRDLERTDRRQDVVRDIVSAFRNLGDRTPRDRDDTFAYAEREAFERFSAEGCPVPRDGRRDDDAIPDTTRRLRAYQSAYESEVVDPALRARTFAALAVDLDPDDASYLLGLAAMTMLDAGDLDAARAYGVRLRALGRGTNLEPSLRLLLALATNDIETVRREARTLLRLDPLRYEWLTTYFSDPHRTGEQRANEAVETFVDAECNPHPLTFAMLRATGAPEREIEVAETLYRMPERYDTYDTEEQEDAAFHFAALHRDAARAPASSLLRCIAGPLTFADGPLETSSLVAVPSHPPTSANGARVRATIEACERVPTARHTPQSIAAWAKSLRAESSVTRAMYETFLSNSASSRATPEVEAMRIRALLGLGRFDDAYVVWSRATDLACPRGASPDLLGLEEIELLTPELGALALLGGDPARNAVYRGRWEVLRAMDDVDPMWLLAAEDVERGALDRLSLFQLTPDLSMSSREVEGYAASLARSPASRLARLRVLESHRPGMPDTRCGPRTSCVALARELLASGPTNPMIASAVARFHLAFGELAEARRIVVAALEAHPDDETLRELLETQCEQTSDPTCERAYACCMHVAETRGEHGASASYTCSGISSEDEGESPPAVCGAVLRTLRGSLEARGVPIPEECE